MQSDLSEWDEEIEGVEKLELVDPTVFDPRNVLNDLTGREWLKETKSVWYYKTQPRDALTIEHPATFDVLTAERLVKFFTKKGMMILDPFVGTGTTLLACLRTKRKGIGIELTERWLEICKQRIASSWPIDMWLGSEFTTDSVNIISGDARDVLKDLQAESIDFVLTSPPYWSILNKKSDKKTKEERLSKGLDLDYSDDPMDLGNIIDYDEFLMELQSVFAECHRLLKMKRWIAILVKDFGHGGKYIMFHSDVVRSCEEIGFRSRGLIILVHDHSKLYPYGYPFVFLPNIHHDYILLLQKIS